MCYSNKTKRICPLLGKFYTHSPIQTQLILPKPSSLSRNLHPSHKPEVYNLPFSLTLLTWFTLAGTSQSPEPTTPRGAAEELGGHEGGGEQWSGRRVTPCANCHQGVKVFSRSHTFSLHFCFNTYTFFQPPPPPPFLGQLPVHPHGCWNEEAHVAYKLWPPAWPTPEMNSYCQMSLSAVKKKPGKHMHSEHDSGIKIWSCVPDSVSNRVFDSQPECSEFDVPVRGYLGIP